MDKATPTEIKDTIAELESEMAQQEPTKEEPKAETPSEPPKEAPKAEVAEKPRVESRARRSDAIPASKFHEVRHELQAEKERARKLEQEIADLRAMKSEPKGDDLDEVASRIAADKADPDVVREILRAARESAPKADTSAIDARLAALEAEKAKAEDANLYRKEEDSVLAKHPALKDYAKELKELAYTPGNEAIPLEYLALKLKADLNLGDSAAPSESVSVPPSGKPKDYGSLSEEEFANLSDKEMEIFIKRNTRR